MTDHADHELARHTLQRTQLGSVDADFLRRAGGASSFPRALLPFDARRSRLLCGRSRPHRNFVSAFRAVA